MENCVIQKTWQLCIKKHGKLCIKKHGKLCIKKTWQIVSLKNSTNFVSKNDKLNRINI